MTQQLDIIFVDSTESKKQKPTVASLTYGTVFSVAGNPNFVYMKTRPVAFLLNSSLIQEVIARGDCVVVNLSTFNTCILKGNQEVVVHNSELWIKKS